MKKIILSLSVFALLTTVSVVQAQNLKIMNPSNGNAVVNGATLNYWGDPSHLMEALLNVQNTTSNNMTVFCKRDTISTVSASDNYFCWVSCYTPTVNQSPTGFLIKADSINTAFVGWYNPGGVTGITKIRYVYFDQANPSDSSWVIVNYNVTPTGIATYGSIGENSLSPAYPNPTANLVSLNYSLASNATAAKIIFYNMLGQQIKNVIVDVNNREGIVKTDVTGMDAGVYFYSFVVNGKTIATKKLVVTH